ncbi:NmrA-like family domain-containing protein [Tolypocladium ophioglossoides CBS 100239]|uniref:NmrA-like family domain-containing protein n=1 Tax=Tolypocladium ophioglossoides (strain CBS 100239) TaxID=1163406 RepID=A0A0L0MXF3_TOLOC|nr:NmrA-like family domain-containing protein [Tolypocladium ophioglossoides CBS 100239]
MSPPTVFVCGITGSQGGAVARSLLHNASIHALVRDPSSPAAAAISSLGAKLKLVPGDYANESAIRAAMAGCSAAFLNLSPDLTDPGAELRYAMSIIAIAKEAGIKHMVYASSLAVNDPERLPNWDPHSPMAVVLRSKQAIEKEVRAAGFQNWTILRPGNFMSNYFQPVVRMYAGLAETGRWTTALHPNSVLPMVDVATIGNFASAAILDPEKFHEQEVEIVDEFLTTPELMAKLSAAAGRELQAVYLSDDEVAEQKKTNPMISVLLMMRDLSIFVDLEKVKSWGIPLSSFEAFLEKEKDRVLETYKDIL